MSDLLNKAKCVTQTESAFAKCAIWAHRDAPPPTHHPSLPPARDAELPLGAVCIHDLVVGVDDSDASAGETVQAEILITDSDAELH